MGETRQEHKYENDGLTMNDLNPLRTGPYTSAHLVRWCAAQQNWDKIHYDVGYAQKYGGLPERVINGALKQHLLVRFLVEAFDGQVRVVRLNYKFAGPDFIGESLEIRGRILKTDSVAGGTAAHVELELWNEQQSKITTSGSAIVMLDVPAHSDNDWQGLPTAWCLEDTGDAEDASVPAEIRALLGRDDEQVTSFCALDLSRLRLFADAVEGLRSYHYDQRAAAHAGLPGVVAPPLFPIHALEPVPGTLALSKDEAAMGREAVNEVGRNFARRFGFPGNGMVNGGNDCEVHSLLKVGETVAATSRLLSARVKAGARGGDMLLTTSLNTYRTTSGRTLLREKQLIIYRNFNAKAAGT
jgi:acyl dehydratase